MSTKNTEIEIIKSGDTFLEDKNYEKALEFYLKDFENYKNIFEEKNKLSKKEYFELQVLLNKIVGCYWELENLEKEYEEYYFRSLQQEEKNIFSDNFDSSNDNFSNYSQDILKIKEEIFEKDNNYFNKLNYGFILTKYIEFGKNLDVKRKIEFLEKSLKIKNEILEEHSTELNKESIQKSYSIFIDSIGGEFFNNDEGLLIKDIIIKYYNFSEKEFLKNKNYGKYKYLKDSIDNIYYFENISKIERIKYLENFLELLNENSKIFENGIIFKNGTIFENSIKYGLEKISIMYFLSKILDENKDIENSYKYCVRGINLCLQKLNDLLGNEEQKKEYGIVYVDDLIRIYRIFIKIDLDILTKITYLNNILDIVEKFQITSNIYNGLYLHLLFILGTYYSSNGLENYSIKIFEKAYNLIKTFSNDYIEELENDLDDDELNEYKNEKLNIDKKYLNSLSEKEILLLKKGILEKKLYNNDIIRFIQDANQRVEFYELLTKYNIRIIDQPEKENSFSIRLVLLNIVKLGNEYSEFDTTKSIEIYKKGLKIIKQKNIKSRWSKIFYNNLLHQYYMLDDGEKVEKYLQEYKEYTLSSDEKEEYILFYETYLIYKKGNLEEAFKKTALYIEKYKKNYDIIKLKCKIIYKNYKKLENLGDFEKDFLYIIDKNKQNLNNAGDKKTINKNKKIYDTIIENYLYLSAIYHFLGKKYLSSKYKILAEENIKNGNTPKIGEIYLQTYNEMLYTSKSELEKLKEGNIKMIQKINCDIGNKINNFSENNKFESKDFENWNKGMKESLRLINIASLNEYISQIPDLEKKEKAQNELVKYFDSHLEKKWLIDTRKSYANKLFIFLVYESIILVGFIGVGIYLSYIGNNKNIIDFIQVFVSAGLLQIAGMVLVIVKYLFGGEKKEDNKLIST